jgi:SOS-response transcriptional repressor LexA
MATYNVGQRLELLIKSMNKKQGEFAKDFSISNNSLIRYKTNERLPEAEFLYRLGQAKVNLNWLLNGEGSMYLVPPWEIKLEPKRAKKGDDKKDVGKVTDSIEDVYMRTNYLPVSADISAGDPIPVPENFEFAEHIEIPKSYLREKGAQYLAFRVNGKSMEPAIQNNDMVVIKRCYDWSGTDGMVCAVRFEGSITLKRVQFDPKRQEIILQPLNSDFRVLVLDSLQSEALSLIGTIAILVRFC